MSFELRTFPITKDGEELTPGIYEVAVPQGTLITGTSYAGKLCLTGLVFNMAPVNEIREIYVITLEEGENKLPIGNYKQIDSQMTNERTGLCNLFIFEKIPNV